MKAWMLVLWPSFLVAGVGEGLFFTLFDPVELHPFGHAVELSRHAAYTVGFIAFWALGAAASALTLWLTANSSAREARPL